MKYDYSCLFRFIYLSWRAKYYSFTSYLQSYICAMLPANIEALLVWCSGEGDFPCIDTGIWIFLPLMLRMKLSDDLNRQTIDTTMFLYFIFSTVLCNSRQSFGAYLFQRFRYVYEEHNYQYFRLHKAQCFCRIMYKVRRIRTSEQLALRKHYQSIIIVFSSSKVYSIFVIVSCIWIFPRRTWY